MEESLPRDPVSQKKYTIKVGTSDKNLASVLPLNDLLNDLPLSARKMESRLLVLDDF